VDASNILGTRCPESNLWWFIALHPGNCPDRICSHVTSAFIQIFTYWQFDSSWSSFHLIRCYRPIIFAVETASSNIRIIYSSKALHRTTSWPFFFFKSAHHPLSYCLFLCYNNNTIKRSSLNKPRNVNSVSAFLLCISLAVSVLWRSNVFYSSGVKLTDPPQNFALKHFSEFTAVSVLSYLQWKLKLWVCVCSHTRPNLTFYDLKPGRDYTKVKTPKKSSGFESRWI
jgi:hypothetical protein